MIAAESPYSPSDGLCSIPDAGLHGGNNGGVGEMVGVGRILRLGCLSSWMDSYAIALFPFKLLRGGVTQWGSFLRRGVHLFSSSRVCSLWQSGDGLTVVRRF